jgi:hypothetical protein
MPINVGYL